MWTGRGRFLLCLMSIAAALLLLFYNGPELYNDYGIQLGIASQMAQGHGIAIPSVEQATALDNWIYTPVTWWPPAHSTAIALLLPVTHDVWWAAYSVEALYIAVFFLAWYIIIELLPPMVTAHVQTGIWLIWLLLAPPLTNGTNQGALAFYSLSLACLLALIRLPRQVLWLSLGAGLGVMLACFLRYAYMPLLIVFPLVIGRLFWKTHNRRLIAAEAIYSVIVAGGLLLLALFVQSGHGTPANATKGFYWENLTKFYPFPADMIGGNGIHYLMSRFGLPEALFWGVGWALSLILIGVLLWAAWQMFRRPPSDPDDFMAEVLWAHGGMTLALVCGSLAYLSVRSPAQGGIWTFVQEMRYFAPTWGYFVIAVAVFASNTALSNTGKRLRILVFIVFTVCLLLQGAVRTVTFATLVRKLPLGGGESRILQPTYRILRQAVQSGRPVVYMTCDYFDMATLRAEIALATVAIYDGPFSSELALEAAQPVTVVMGVPKQPKAACTAPLMAWIERYSAVKIGDIGDFATAYSVELPKTPPSLK